MNKKTTTRTLLTAALGAAAIFVSVSANDASARASTKTPSIVTNIGVPAQGFSADNLIDQLKPLGFSKVYDGFFHLMAENHYGEIKRLWVGKADGKTAVF